MFCHFNLFVFEFVCLGHPHIFSFSFVFFGTFQLQLKASQRHRRVQCTLLSIYSKCACCMFIDLHANPDIRMPNIRFVLYFVRPQPSTFQMFYFLGGTRASREGSFLINTRLCQLMLVQWIKLGRRAQFGSFSKSWKKTFLKLFVNCALRLYREVVLEKQPLQVRCVLM